MLGQRPVSETNTHSLTKDGTITSTGYLKVLVCTVFENLNLVRIGYLLFVQHCVQNTACIALPIQTGQSY